jgi:ABC-type transporter Mla subunit MlaD
MMRKVLFAISIIALLTSCDKSTNLNFKTNDARGLEIGDPILIDEQAIGEVTGFGMTDKGDVIISSSITTDIPIPSNSKFKNTPYTKEGQRCIKVTLGNSDMPFNDSDTIKLSASGSKIIEEGKEKLIDKIKEKFGKKGE